MKRVPWILALLLTSLCWGQSAPYLPPEVRQASAVILKASDRDGIHEEAFKWGRDASGKVLISYSKPGKPCSNGVCNEDFTPADSSVDERFISIDGFVHVHPKGDAKHAPVQPPSKEDLVFAAGIPGTVNIVIGAGSHLVYFFDGSGVTSTVKLKDFLEVK